MLHLSVMPHRLACALTLALAFGQATAAPIPWTDGQAATVVLGADNFTTGDGGASASRFKTPNGICTDQTTGKVFVVVLAQHRILRFASDQAITNGGVAEAVFGQPDFSSATDNNGGLSARSLYWPTVCTVDAGGRLFVADSGNHRVLRYDNAATKATFSPADGVLGQPGFTTSNTGTTASQFSYGTLFGLALGPNGALYVSDQRNQRVLRFNNAATKANGASADGVLGAPNFTTPGVVGTTASTFSTSILGLTVDAAGSLYVSDVENRRILRFDNAAGKTNGGAADGVLGAPDFTTPGSGTASASNMSTGVFGIEVLADGTLYATDLSYNRVLIYNDAAHKANGANADHVLGQSDFTSFMPGLSATRLSSPLGLSYNAHAGYLLVVDRTTNRVVGYSPKVNSAPTAGNVIITGTPTQDQPLTGSYTYADADSDPEGTSIFVWKRGATTISGATDKTYIPVSADVGQQLSFCVIPVASTGAAMGTQTCSAPTAPVAAAPVNGACGAAAGPAQTVAPASSLCSAGMPGVVSSSGGQYTWQCQGQSGGSTASCEAPWASTGGGKGSVTLNPGNGWQVNNASFSTTPPAPAPQGATFPAGVLTLDLDSGNLGSDATVTLNFTTPMPAGAVYMKYGSSPDGYNCHGAACAQPHWYELPANRAVLTSDRLSATLTLTDGGLGDSDSVANRVIQDPGGFALKAAPVPGGTQAIPTLSEWGLIFMSSILAMVGISRMRRRQR